MANWVGTIVGLWDLAVRVATFANDIRSAQDDFVSLRAEAECLLICINSLNSPSCRDTLYKYINAEQASDLDSLVKNTELNMQDLNKFIAKCWRLVERDLRRDNVRRRGWKRLPTRLKEMVAKTWARYWFTMTDKQAFRDKLVLPAQSVNIYLTSLTHIGLVNVGFLMQLSGHGGAEGCACACSGGGGGGGGAGGGGIGGRNGGGGGGGGVIVKVNPCDGWQAVGRRLAFRDPIVKKSDLTTDLEEEIIIYALYLMRGGTPFNAKGSGGGGNSGRGKYKVSKTTTTTKTRTRSRSRSLGPMGLGKGNNGKKYVVRKKSVSRPSTERIEIVEREYVSESNSDGHPHRRVLALPAPDSPSSASGAQFVEIKPPSRPSSSSSSDDSGNNGPGPGPGRSPRPSPPTSPPGNGAGLHPDSARRERRRNDGHPNPGLLRPNPSARTSGYETSREALSARRRRVLNSIQDEGDAAVAELEAKQAASRDDRRRFRRASRPADYHPTPEQERDKDNEDDIFEMCNIIKEEYGVRVVRLPEGARDPILAPMVRPAAPVPEEEVEAEIRLESRESGRRSRRSKASRLALESSESEASEVEDEELVKSMSRGRTDRLKAETSILESASGFAYGPRSYAYEDPLRRTRSAYDNPASRVRFEPYPTSPYDRHREQQRRRSRYPTEFYDDYINVRPDPGDVETINIEPMSRRPSHPHGRDDSDDDSYYGPSRPAPKPRGPGPGPPPPAQIFVQRKEDKEQEAERMRETREKLMREDMEQHRARMYDEERIIIVNDGPSRRRPPSRYDPRRIVSHSAPIISHDYEHGPASGTLKRRPIDRERRSSQIIESVDDEDVYMSGARHENDVLRRYESDDEDDHHEIRIVRDE
jgi:hypothetical protein